MSCCGTACTYTKKQLKISSQQKFFSALTNKPVAANMISNLGEANIDNDGIWQQFNSVCSRGIHLPKHPVTATGEGETS